MKMQRSTDEWIVVLILSGAFVSDASLFISKSSETKLVNETFVVVCRDEGGFQVKWKGPNGVLGPKTRPVAHIATYGTSIIFNNVKNGDAGIYTCSAGDKKKEFHLTVEEPLKFTDTETSQIGEEGKNVTLRCEVIGGKVSWSLDGADIVDSLKYNILGDGLLIKNLHRSDSKTYICKGVQAATGMVLDRKINLRVLHKPRFPHPTYVNQEMAWGYLNGTVNLTCVVMADPIPKFEWQKVNDKKKKIGKIINQSNVVSILQLFVDKHTFGDYKCIATNTYGTLEKRFRLDEAPKPLPPRNLSVTNTTSTAVELEILGADPMNALGYTMKFWIKGNAAEWQIKEVNLTAENRYVVEELGANSEYELQVATRNLAGLSEYNTPIAFHTEKSLSCAPQLASFLFVAVILLDLHHLAS